jgi:YebC/PmpR family DNA-binding regulatory protein
MAKEIENAVKLSGPDPNTNPRLALAISIAKKAGIPKANIEAALARGKGISLTGAALESVTLEAILPPSVATVIDCLTDNKLRALADLRLLVKDCGGNVTPIGYLFERKGKVVFRKKEGLGVDEILDPALDAGALDVEEDDEGRIILYTEPMQTKSTAETLAKDLELEIEQTEIIYDPNEDTKVGLDDEEAVKSLGKFLDVLQDFPGIQGVYLNWKKGEIPEELWAELQSKTEL